MNGVRAIFRIVGALAITVGAVRVAGSAKVMDQPENIGLIILGAVLLFIGLILRDRGSE